MSIHLVDRRRVYDALHVQFHPAADCPSNYLSKKTMKTESAVLYINQFIAMLSRTSTHDLHRIEQLTRKIRNEPHRIRRIRENLRLGMNVQFLCDQDGTRHMGQIIEMNALSLTIRDTSARTHWHDVPYAALIPAGEKEVDALELLFRAIQACDARMLSKNDFDIDDSVLFLDGGGCLRSGYIIELGKSTATVRSETGDHEVSYTALHHPIHPELKSAAGAVEWSMPKSGLTP